MQEGSATRSLARLGPPVVLALITAVDLLGGSSVVVLALVVIAPLLAAVVLPVRATAVYAAAALLIAVLLGFVDDLYDDGDIGAQSVRLLGVAFGGVVAVVASRARLQREARLAHVTLVAAAAAQALLTHTPTRVGQVEVATCYRSADEEAGVGGDFYEVAATPWGVRVLVGDVKGKGLDAVDMAARLLGAFRALGGSRELGEDVLDDLESVVARSAGPEDFATAVLLQLRGDELLVWSAGHPPPLLVRDGAVIRLEPDLPQPPLGLAPSPVPHSYRLGPDDVVLLYTDGLIEARQSATREFFPLEEAAPRLLRPGSLATGLSALMDEVVAWTGGMSDDVAMVLLRPSPPGEDRWLRRSAR